jgi:hypothetical protein
MLLCAENVAVQPMTGATHCGPTNRSRAVTAAEWRSVWTPTPSTPGGLGSDLDHPQKVARIDLDRPARS